MRPRALLGLLAAAATLPAPAMAEPAAPQWIMSVNLCTDLLLLQLVPRRRIASVSFLAHGGVAAIGPDLDAGVAVNHGTAEEVAIQRPDLILAGAYSTPVIRRFAARIGAPVVEVKDAESFADIRAALRQVGKAVGEPARAEALIARMDRTLAELKAAAPRRTPTVAAWSGDSAPGRRSLTDAIITAAGATNLAAALPGDRTASLDLEQLLAARPDALLYDDADAGPSRRRQVVAHPVLQALYRGRRIGHADAPYACGLPQSADAARDLRRALAALPPGPPAP